VHDLTFYAGLYVLLTELEDNLAAAMEDPVAYSFMLNGGDDINLVQCCAYPGEGSVMITGTEPEDVSQDCLAVLPATPLPSIRYNSVHSAAEIALLYLTEVQEEEWFKALPEGFRRFDIRRMQLLIENEKTKKVRRVKANLHIHFNISRYGTGYMGAPTALAIAQVMRGASFQLKTAAMGEVGASGMLVPLKPVEQAITAAGVDRLLYVRHEGDLNFGKPNAREGLDVQGFSYLKDMLIYAFDDEEDEVEEE
jgi:hypothetical protein